MQVKRLELFLESITSFMLILVGLVGITIGIFDFVGLENKLLSITKDPITLVLLTIGLLSLAVGLERVIRLRHQNKQFDQIERLLAKSSGGQFLKGVDEIYGTTMRLCSAVQNNIKTIVFASGPKAPHRWAETVARRLRETKQSGAPAKFEVVIALDFDQLAVDFKQNMEARNKLYERFGVFDLVSLNLLNIKPCVGFDILILDRRHVVIGFTTFTGIRQLQSAILFENQPHIASEFADWFDQFIIRSAIPYESWASTH